MIQSIQSGWKNWTLRHPNWHWSTCKNFVVFLADRAQVEIHMEILGIPALVARAWSQHRSVPAPGRQSQSAQWQQWQQWQHKTSRLGRKEVENHVARLWLLACSAYRSTVHSYAAPLWLLPLCLSDMGQSQGNVPEKQPTSASYHRSFIKRHLHNGKEPKREAKGRDDLTKIALPSVRYAPEWQQLLKARLELCIPLDSPLSSHFPSQTPHLLLPSKQPHLKLFTMLRDINPLVLGGFPSTMGYSHWFIHQKCDLMQLRSNYI